MMLLPPSNPASHARVDWYFDKYSVVHAAIGALFALSKVPIAYGARGLMESNR